MQKLFGAWGRKPSVDELLAYATGLRSLTLAQIEAAVDASIEDITGDYPPCAGEVRRKAPTVAALSTNSDTRKCLDCSGTGWRITQQKDANYGSFRKAVLCECVQGEARAKLEEWLRK